MSWYKKAMVYNFKQICEDYVFELNNLFNNHIDSLNNSKYVILSDDDILIFYEKYLGNIETVGVQDLVERYHIDYNYYIEISSIIGDNLGDVMNKFDLFLEGRDLSNICVIGLYTDETKTVTIKITIKP